MIARTRQRRHRWLLLEEAGRHRFAICALTGTGKTSLLRNMGRSNLRGQSMSATGVQLFFGLAPTSARTVRRWESRGWLRSYNAGTDSRPRPRYKTEAVLSMMENDQTWFAWNPDLIPDPALREWAWEVREGRPAWLTPSQVAERAYRSLSAVLRACKDGRLRATHYAPRWWIREPDAEAWIAAGLAHPLGPGWLSLAQCTTMTDLSRSRLTQCVTSGELPATMADRLWWVAEDDFYAWRDARLHRKEDPQ